MRSDYSPSRAAYEEQKRNNRLPRWVLALIVGLFALCITCAAFGYFVVLPRGKEVIAGNQDAVSNQLAENVAASIAVMIRETVRPDGTLALGEGELDVNNAVAIGESGFETGSDGTRIFGIVTEIDLDGIHLVMGDGLAYSGMPMVVEGRVELLNISVSSRLMGLFLTEDGFAQGMADGINDALAAAGLSPVSLTLSDGSMVITTTPKSRAPSWVDANSGSD